MVRISLFSRRQSPAGEHLNRPFTYSDMMAGPIRLQLAVPLGMPTGCCDLGVHGADKPVPMDKFAYEVVIDWIKRA